MFANLDTALASAATRLAPWLAPVVTAYAVGDAIHTRLHFPLAVAAVAGAAIECMGIAAANRLLQLYQYNCDRNKADPRATLLWASIAVSFYFVAVVLLTIAIGADPVLLVFPALSASAALVIALGFQHEMRLRRNAERKADARAERQRKAAERATQDAPQPIASSAKWPQACELCAAPLLSPQAKAAHMRHYHKKGTR